MIRSVPTWVGNLFLTPGAFLYLGQGASAARHAHHAVQLVVAESATVDVVTGNDTLSSKAALVGSGVEHSLTAQGRIAILLVEAHGARGRALNTLARASAIDASALIHDATALFSLSSVDDFERWYESLVKVLLGPANARSLSASSRRAIEFVETNLQGTPRLVDAAANQGVSASRLTHVFSAEVGIPFRRFVLWARIKRAVTAARSGADLTRIAADAGFSDSAHLSRTFRDMFGLSPSLLLPHAKISGRTS